ncbi:MAG: rhodanese-like domain-containing protein [Planctomycetota bacterium]|nr:rhodanese-like domain-containing protein [Planctomycetota bacterium]MDA1213700.1 rhodanese-like domain-containing protein [Planctomycetota bacterium]
MNTPGQNQFEIDCHGVDAKRKNGETFLFVDCREADEYATAHIEGTVLIPMSEIDTRVGELETQKNDEIIVHCHHGGRSLRVAHWLAEKGFTNVKSMAGGIDQWASEIDPSIQRY